MQFSQWFTHFLECPNHGMSELSLGSINLESRLLSCFFARPFTLSTQIQDVPSAHAFEFG